MSKLAILALVSQLMPVIAQVATTLLAQGVDKKDLVSLLTDALKGALQGITDGK